MVGERGDFTFSISQVALQTKALVYLLNFRAKKKNENCYFCTQVKLLKVRPVGQKFPF